MFYSLPVSLMSVFVSGADEQPYTTLSIENRTPEYVEVSQTKNKDTIIVK